MPIPAGTKNSLDIDSEDFMARLSKEDVSFSSEPVFSHGEGESIFALLLISEPLTS
jgi:hypothetical protein